MRWACTLIAWSIVALLAVLVPLAQASPPDPTYLAGIWDNADYDDIVILVTSSTGSTDTCQAIDLIRPLVVVAVLLPGAHALQPAASLSLQPSRAPPAL
jgi:hypothetical protein